MTYCVRLADSASLDAVVKLIEDRTDWLAARGSDQWSTRRHELRERMAAKIADQQTWLLYDRPSSAIVATISVTTTADQDFWTADERATPALYLSRLATSTAPSARGTGRILLDWATQYAGQQGCTEVRLDAWRSADGLHRYYVDHGWTFLRTETVPGRRSGALFSKTADRTMRIPEISPSNVYAYEGD